MMSSPQEHDAVARAELEAPLAAVEASLAALALALHAQDAQAVDTRAADLHAALAAAVDHFQRAARNGGVPRPMRHRLALAGGRMAAQREALARATASLDRALDVLLPAPAAAPPALYSAFGNTTTRGSGGGLLA